MTTRRQVLHVIDSLGQNGGAEQQLVNNLRRFKDQSLEHRLLCLYESEGITRASDLPVSMQVDYLFRRGTRSRNRLRLIAGVYREMRANPPDVVHCALPDAALAARVAGRLTGVPVVESLVNISHEPVRTIDNPAVTERKLRMHRLLDRWTMRWVTRFHALTEEVARSWSETVAIPRERIEVIPRGVDVVDLPDPAAREQHRKQILGELSLPADTFIMLNIGRQVAQKGQLYAVRAMPHVLESAPNAVLLVAGSTGGMSGRLRSESERLGVADHVHWLGVRKDINVLLGAADVFVFPSLYEGLGVSLLQALGSGIPSITTDRPPMSTVVTGGTTGWLVGAQDEDALAVAVLDVVADAQRTRQIGEAGRRHVLAEYDSNEVAGRIEALYRSTMTAGDS